MLSPTVIVGVVLHGLLSDRNKMKKFISFIALLAMFNGAYAATSTRTVTKSFDIDKPTTMSFNISNIVQGDPLVINWTAMEGSTAADLSDVTGVTFYIKNYPDSDIIATSDATILVATNGTGTVSFTGSQMSFTNYLANIEVVAQFSDLTERTFAQGLINLSQQFVTGTEDNWTPPTGYTLGQCLAAGNDGDGYDIDNIDDILLNRILITDSDALSAGLWTSTGNISIVPLAKVDVTGQVETDTLVVNTGSTLPAGDIITADIADDAVTVDKIADDAVGDDQLQDTITIDDLTVSTSISMPSSSVGSAEITDGSVADVDISSDFVHADEADTVTGALTLTQPITVSEQIASPGTPASGYGTIFSKGNNLYYIDDEGNENSLLAFSGTNDVVDIENVLLAGADANLQSLVGAEYITAKSLAGVNPVGTYDPAAVDTFWNGDRHQVGSTRGNMLSVTQQIGEVAGEVNTTDGGIALPKSENAKTVLSATHDEIYDGLYELYDNYGGSVMTWLSPYVADDETASVSVPFYMFGVATSWYPRIDNSDYFDIYEYGGESSLAPLAGLGSAGGSHALGWSYKPSNTIHGTENAIVYADGASNEGFFKLTGIAASGDSTATSYIGALSSTADGLYQVNATLADFLVTRQYLSAADYDTIYNSGTGISPFAVAYPEHVQLYRTGNGTASRAVNGATIWGQYSWPWSDNITWDGGAVWHCGSTASWSADSSQVRGFAVQDIVLWLRADDLVGTYDDGDEVLTWSDISGNGYDATGSTGSAPTLDLDGFNGRPTLSFDGTELLTANLGGATGDFSIFFVSNSSKNVADGTTSVAFGPNAATGLSFLYTYNSLWYNKLATVTGANVTGSTPTSANHVFSAVHDDLTSLTLYRTGESIGSDSSITNSVSFSDLIIGAQYAAGTNPHVGDIAEIIIINKALSNEERQWFEGYLAWKYGLQSNLVAGHGWEDNMPVQPLYGGWATIFDSADSAPPTDTALIGPAQEVAAFPIVRDDGQNAVKVSLNDISITTDGDGQWTDGVTFVSQADPIGFITGKVENVWLPTDIPETIAWYDATALLEKYEDGDGVTEWENRARLGHDATATAGTAPTFDVDGFNGYPTLAFDGTEFLAIPDLEASGDFSVFIVSNNTADTGKLYQIPLGNSASYSSPLFYYMYNGTVRYGVIWDGSSSTLSTSDYSSNNVMSAVFDGGTSATLHGNGTLLLTDASVSSSISLAGLNIGSCSSSASYGAIGDISEVIIVNKALSSTEREKFEGYLADKYGITLNAGHTYETAPPVGGSGAINQFQVVPSLITGGNFEAADAAWNLSIEATRSSTYAHSGTYSLKMQEGELTPLEAYYDASTYSAGAYAFSAMARAGSGTATINMGFFPNATSNAAAIGSPYQTFTVGTEWTRISAVITLKSSASVSPYLYCGWDDVAYVDDFSVVAMDEVPLTVTTASTAQSWTEFDDPGTLEGSYDQLLIDPHDEVTVPASVLSADAGTISFWVRPNTLEYNYVVDSGSLFIGNSSTTPGATGFRANGSGVFSKSTTALTVGEWAHLAFTWGDGVQRIYVNGVLEDSDTYAANMSLASLVHIGSSPDNVGFQGYMANLGIWKRALSPEEIWAVANAKLPVAGQLPQTEHEMREIAKYVTTTAIDEGDAVCIDANGKVGTTTTAGSDLFLGIALGDAAIGEEVWVGTQGIFTADSTGTINIGDLVETSTTAGAVEAVPTPQAGTAPPVAMTAASGGQVTIWIK